MTRSRLVAATIGAVLIGACGGTDGGPTPPPAARSIQVVAGNTQTGAAGAQLTSPVTFAVTDGGKPASGTIVSFQVLDGGGRLVADTDVTDLAGHARAFWVLGRSAGSPQTLDASVSATSGSALIAHAVVSATVVAGPDSALVASVAAISARVSEPSAQRVSIAIVDSIGNRVATAGRVIKVRSQDAGRATILSQSSSTTDATGAASFDNLVAAGRTGSVDLVFEAPGLAAAHVNMTLAAGAPTQLVAVDNPVIRAVANAGGPPIRVRVADAGDNGVLGIDVSFALQGAALGHASTDSAGIATLANWHVPATGTYTLIVNAAGVTAPVTQSVVAAAGPPASVTLVSLSSTVVATRAVAKLAFRDAGGNTPQLGAVGYSVTNGESGVFALDDNGMATLTMTLPTKAGASQIVFSVNGSAVVTLPITILAGTIVKVAVTSSPQSVSAGSVINFVAHGTDTYGNATSGVPLTATMGDWVYDTPAPAVITTDAQGNAQFSFPTNRYAGPRNFDVYTYTTAFVDQSFTVYATAAKGTAVLFTIVPCVGQAQISTGVSARLFLPSGHEALGAPVTFSVASGNGFLLPQGSPYPPVGTPPTNIVATADSNGFASVGWYVQRLPGVFMPPGTYTLSINTGSAYDPSTLTHTCTITP
jgi:hypothetical protein